MLSPSSIFSCPLSTSAPDFASDPVNAASSWEWPRASPWDMGFNGTKLDLISDFIESAQLNIDSIIIVKDGFIVYEEYPSESFSAASLHAVASCTKSIISMLLGVALQEGYIDSVEQRVMDFYPDRVIQNMDETKLEIRISHLLTMTSGLEWDQWSYDYEDLRNSATQMYTSDDPIQYVLDLPMAYAPGEKWVYSCGSAHILADIIERKSGMSILEFANHHLFAPLDIEDVYWAQDSAGNYKGGGGLYLRPLDLAKLGVLSLNGGAWEGIEIVPEGWIRSSCGSEVELGSYGTEWGAAGYGYFWWTVPSLGLHYAAGTYGQRVYVQPLHNLVVVFTASTDDVSTEDRILTELILPSIVEAETSNSLWPFVLLSLMVLPPIVLAISADKHLTALSRLSGSDRGC
jgi:CubicO group peptidase (beta-lactamase class C family)